MVSEIKQIVKNYLNTLMLTEIVTAEVIGSDYKISEKLTIPSELVAGNLKKTVTNGDRVRILRNHGGQQFFILEVIEDDS